MSRVIALLLAVALPTLAAAAPKRVTMLPLSGGKGLDSKSLKLLEDAVIGELRHRTDLSVLTQDDVKAVLREKQQAQLLGCDQGPCLSDLGGAIGCEELVTASVGRLGKSWVLIVRRVDVTNASVVREVNRRLKGAKVDKLLDILPAVVTELFDTGNDAPKPVSAPAPVAVDCAVACGHVLACKGTYVDGDLDALADDAECRELCAAKVALGEDPDSPRKRGRREAVWMCATEATDCLDLDKRCDVY